LLLLLNIDGGGGCGLLIISNGEGVDEADEFDCNEELFELVVAVDAFDIKEGEAEGVM